MSKKKAKNNLLFEENHYYKKDNNDSNDLDISDAEYRARCDLGKFLLDWADETERFLIFPGKSAKEMEEAREIVRKAGKKLAKGKGGKYLANDAEAQELYDELVDSYK